MISYQKAIKIINKVSLNLPNEEISISDSLNRVCAKNILSPSANPLANNTAFDGFAVLAKETKGLSKKKVKKFKILKTIGAGDNPRIKNYLKNSSVEIMTGGIVPKPFDSIIPVEKIKYYPSKKKPTHIFVDSEVKKFSFIRFAGEDYNLKNIGSFKRKKIIFKNIKRNSLRFSQTPQGFTFKKIYEKHKKNMNTSVDDDSALFTNDGEKVLSINGSKTNIKITDKEDLNIFKSLKKGKTYSGIGFDILRLVKGRKLYLGGIKIPFALGLQGHSDADPVLHAIIDSLLGACKLGDIGKLFSNKNNKYKNIRSTILLKKVIELIKSKNFSINNVDINIIVQKPRIKKYSKRMIQTISKICEINSNQINIKGKTTEKLGLIGKGEAIACETISSVIKYD